MKYELAIAIKDAEGNRKKEGDLIAVIPHGAQWGSKVIGEYFIVVVETSLDFDELRNMCAQRVYRRKSTGELMSQEEHTNLVESEDGADPADFEPYAKNRYSISFDAIKQHIPDLNMVKVQDEKYVYQPFKTASKLVEGFDGKDGHNFLNIKDMDTVCSVAGEETELVVNLDTAPSIIEDIMEKKNSVNLKKIRN